MIAVAISIGALLVGPILYGIAHRSRTALSAIDGLAFTSIGGIVLLDALPEAFSRAGWIAIAAAAAGFFLPGSVERSLKRAAAGTHRAALIIAMVGLGIHAAIDGAALISADRGVILAVIIHRIPVSLTIWLLLGTSHTTRGTSWAIGGLLLAAAGTLIGAAAGAHLPLDTRTMGAVLGLVSGSLLHVLVHWHTDRPAETKGWPSGLGGLAGIGLVFGLSMLDHAEPSPTAQTFLALALSSAPALLFAYLGAGLLSAFLPQATVGWLRGGSPLGQSLRGVAFGLPLPICSCGVIPLYRGLVSRGAPTTAAMAFLVATPEVGIDAILLSIPLLGPELTVSRVISAATIAVAAGWFVGSRTSEHNHTAQHDQPTHMQTFFSKLRAALKNGYGEVVDNTAPWILLGLAVAAVGNDLLGTDLFASLPPGVDVALFALAGIPTYVCATGATPLVAMLVYKGVSPGAALAFLLTGPATNATTFGVLSRLHDRKTALTFGVLVAGLAIGLGVLLNAALAWLPPFRLPTSNLSAHDHTESLYQTIALAGLTLVVCGSILRQGPREFVAQVYRVETDTHDHPSDEPEQHTACHHC